MNALAGLGISAVLQTKRGDLVIYDSEAVAKVVAALPEVSQLPDYFSDPPPAPPPLELLDGFTIEQWAKFGKLKAEIASRVCRENGSLKKKLASYSHPETRVDLAANDKAGHGGQSCHDVLFEKDPWRRPKNVKIDDDVHSTCFPIELNARSNCNVAASSAPRWSDLGVSAACSVDVGGFEILADALSQ